MAGHCYVSRCTDNGKLEVKVGGGSWNPCPFGESIQVNLCPILINWENVDINHI